MSKLIFMPWYKIERSETIGNYTLEPWIKGRANPKLALVQNEADIILKSYLLRPYTWTDAQARRQEFPVTEASVLRADNDAPKSSEIEILQYIIAFCGISTREFNNQDLYLCSDNLRMITQRYQAPLKNPFDPALSTPRKDGTMGTFFSPGLFREPKPWYIPEHSLSPNQGYRLKFEGDLARCLWAFYKAKGPRKSFWKLNLFPSLFSFYFANTDNLSSQIECIYSQAAIERLFLGSGHKEENLVDAILKFFTQHGINFEPIGTTNRKWQTVSYKDPITQIRSHRPNFHLEVFWNHGYVNSRE